MKRKTILLTSCFSEAIAEGQQCDFSPVFPLTLGLSYKPSCHHAPKDNQSHVGLLSAYPLSQNGHGTLRASSPPLTSCMQFCPNDKGLGVTLGEELDDQGGGSI